MQGAKCAISKLMYGLSVCTDDNHSLKLVAYRLAHTDKPYINLHLCTASREDPAFEHVKNKFINRSAALLCRLIRGFILTA